jgi:hypothetical protein
MSDFESVVGTSRHSSIDELLDELHKAEAAADLKGYFGCYAPVSTFVGSDKTEHWTIQEFLAYASPHFRSGKAWSYEPIVGGRKVTVYSTPGGEEPLFASFNELLWNEALCVTCQGTGTLQYMENCWFICSYHLCIPIPNEIAGPICKKIEIYDQRTAVNDEVAAADRAAAELIASLEADDNELANKIKINSNGGAGKKSKGKKKK